MKTEALGLVIVPTAGIGLKLLTALDYPGFYSRKAIAGEVILVYALYYAVVRFFLEFFRGDPQGYYFNHLLSTSQLISLLIIPAAAFLLGRLRKQAALAKQHQYKTQRVLVLNKTRARAI